ncbi:MAG: PorP/SprF family type IX secretion system membrane protein [Muribaculaceae bacterium]|nr:PorP/SprF family type IX secretion system membrane protein [Muribaculaceae bacterium]
MAATLLLLISTGEARGQNEIMLTQHWALPTLYNPANTGNTDFLRIRAAARLQWIGVENAPRSFIGAADVPFSLGGKRIGVGLTALQESLGLFSNLNLGLQVSYKFKIGKGILSVGVQPAYYNSRFKGSEVILPDGDDYHQGGDSSIPTQDLSGNHFDLSAGVSFTHKYFTVGLSCMHVMSPKINLSLEGSQSNETQQYQTELPRALYLTADGNIPLKNTLFELQPSLLLTSDFSGFTGEAALRTTYNHFITFGLAYRWQDAIGVTIGGEYKNFFLGYAYEYPLSGINKASSGSHEIVAGYSLKLDFSGKNKNKHRSIRLM